MFNFLESIAALLDQNHIGRYDIYGGNSTIFVEILPSRPDNCVGIFLRGGRVDDDIDTTVANVQFIVRDRIKINAMARSERIIKLLHGMSGVTLGNKVLTDSICDQGLPIYLQTDKFGRHEYSINFSMEVNI